MIYLGGDKEMKKLLVRGNHNTNRLKENLKDGIENIEGRKDKKFKSIATYIISVEYCQVSKRQRCSL